MDTAADLARKAANLHAFIDQYLPQGRLTGALPDISTDYVKLQEEVMWGGVWQVPGLEVTLRSMATIAAPVLQRLGVRPPAPDTGRAVAGNVAAEDQGDLPAAHLLRGDTGHRIVPSPGAAGNQRAAHVAGGGQRTAAGGLAGVGGGETGTWDGRSAAGIGASRPAWDLENTLSHELASETAMLVEAYNFGEVWARGDLTPKERTVCILVALMCRGHMRQLREHIGYALELGMSKREICEVFSQAGWYRGWPYVEDALEQADAVFVERGI